MLKKTANTQKNLDRLSEFWQKNASVHHSNGNYDEIVFDESKKDFSEGLLPFHSHPAWQNAPVNIKDMCLSYAWILYNMKTVYIECDIVAPACEDIIKSAPETENFVKVQRVISEALLDEALHTKMSISACNYIYEKRNLKHIGENNFYLSEWLNNKLSSYTLERERRLAHFAVACASETMITDYLDILSEDSDIQDICYEVTHAHALDERSHSGVFSHVAVDILQNANEKEIGIVKETMIETLSVFANTEMGEWEKVFKLVDFPEYQAILRDTETLQNISVYDKSVKKLLSRIGIS